MKHIVSAKHSKLSQQPFSPVVLVGTSTDKYNYLGFKKNISRGVRILEFITFYQNALHLTRMHCANFYQSALHHEQHEDVTPSFRLDSSEKV